MTIPIKTYAVGFILPIFWLVTIQGYAQELTTSKENDHNSFPRIGIIADCQYANQPTKGVRHYQLSAQKLTNCVEKLNTLELDHVFHLGDLIDQHIESYDKVLPIIKRLEAPYSLVLGNHDFSVEDSFKESIPAHNGLDQRYFTVAIKGWRFIVLDGNDISLYAWPQGSRNAQKADSIYLQKYTDREKWNGAIGDSQLKWLRTQLEQADTTGENVVILCHFPILPLDNHVLWNNQQVMNLLMGHSCVKAWFNGHNHAGAYATHDGIHFLTFKGMVDTDETSYGMAELREKKILVTGFGRESDRVLELK